MTGDKITAAAGKVFRRISDGMLFGNEIYLGMAYPKDREPYAELPEHFEETDDPAEAATVLLDEETPIEATPEETALLDESTEQPPDEPVKRVVTMSDYRELERKVELLIRLIGRTE